MDSNQSTLLFKPWKAVYLAFYNCRFYTDVVNSWSGCAYIYLASLLFFINILAVLNYSLLNISTIKKVFIPIAKQIPDLKVTNKVLHINQPSPIIINIPHSQRCYIYIDTTTDKYDTRLSPIIQLSPHFCHINYPDPFGNDINQKNYVTTRVFTIQWESDGNLDQKSLLDAINMFTLMIPPVAFMVFYPICIIICIFQSILYSFLAYVISLIARKPLKFDALVRLSVISMTPGLVLDSFIKTFHINIPSYYSMLMCFSLTLVYLIISISVQEDKAQAQ